MTVSLHFSTLQLLESLPFLTSNVEKVPVLLSGGVVPYSPVIDNRYRTFLLKTCHAPILEAGHILKSRIKRELIVIEVLIVIGTYIARAVITKNTFLGERGVNFTGKALSARIMKLFCLCIRESEKN